MTSEPVGPVTHLGPVPGPPGSSQGYEEWLPRTK
jgi:hypothetical protein